MLSQKLILLCHLVQILNFERGDIGGSVNKIGKRIKELERIYGVRAGSNNMPGSTVGEKISFTQEDLAKKMGMDVRTLQNYKLLSDMIPELEELMDTGIVTKTTALAMMRNLSEDEQEEAKEKQGTRTDLTSSPNGEKVKITHTDKELAKLAGVGTGTVARFNRHYAISGWKYYNITWSY